MSEGPIIGDWTQYEWIPDNASSFPARIRLRDTAWMVYYEPDVTGLKAEVLMLRKENERLHADQAHWELGNCPSCLNVADLQEALEQNAKLRDMMYEHAHVYAIQNMTEDELRITATNVMEENAKLRKLARDMWQLINDLDATPYVTERHGNNPAVTWLDDDWSVHESCRERMCELGIEVTP